MRKLTLDELKVESFVTSMNGEEENTVDGGTSIPCTISVVVVTILCSIVATAAVCPSGVGDCQTTRNPCATPCPATATSNCPGDPTLMGSACPNAVATDVAG
jgi:hypothetical protein